MIKKTRNRDRNKILKQTEVSENQTIVVGVRIKPIDLATIARFLEEIGESPRNPGGILRACAEAFVLHTQCTKFHSERDAIEWLERKGILSAENTSGINREHLSRALQISDLKDRKKEEIRLSDKIKEGVILLNKSMNEEFETFTVHTSDKVDLDNLNPPEENTGEIITLLPKGSGTP